MTDDDDDFDWITDPDDLPPTRESVRCGALVVPGRPINDAVRVVEDAWWRKWFRAEDCPVVFAEIDEVTGIERVIEAEEPQQTKRPTQADHDAYVSAILTARGSD